MKFNVERFYDLGTVLLDQKCLVGILLTAGIVDATRPCCTYSHIELSYFMGILARRRHLDWPSPIVVEVAKGV